MAGRGRIKALLLLLSVFVVVSGLSLLVLPNVSRSLLALYNVMLQITPQPVRAFSVTKANGIRFTILLEYVPGLQFSSSFLFLVTALTILG